MNSLFFGRFLRIRKFLSILTPKFLRKFFPKWVSKRLYFEGFFEVFWRDKTIMDLWNHSELENSIYWNSGDIEGAEEGLSLTIFLTILQELKEIKVVLDGGCNSGTYGLLALAQENSVEQVQFFDPQIEAIYLLKKNLDKISNRERFGEKDVLVFEYALSSESKITELYLDGSKKLNFSATLEYDFDLNNNESRLVNSYTLMDLIKTFPAVRPPQLIKLDVEGHEAKVIVGISELLKDIKVIFVEVLSSTLAQELNDLLSPDDWDFFSIDDKFNSVKKTSRIEISNFRNCLITRKTIYDDMQKILQRYS